MAKGSHKYDDQLRALLEELSESDAQSSDDEILAEVQEGGENPKQAAQKVRNFLQSKVKAYQQRSLHAAQEQYKRRMQNLYKNSFRLPPSTEERRDLLMDVFSLKPEMEAALLTAQHREFKNLSDEDIEGYLKQLQELGVLGVEGQADVEEEK